MFRLSYLMMTISLMLVLGLTACGEDNPEEDAAQAAATATTQPSALLVSGTPLTTPDAVPAGEPAATATATQEPAASEATVTAPPPPFSDPTVSPSSNKAPTATPSPTVLEGLTEDAIEAELLFVTSADEELTTVEVVKLLTPSVVQIVTEVVGMGLQSQMEPLTGVGTGEILDEDGHILTNNHVVADAQTITVTLRNGESYSARVVGRDVNTDLAVIKIDAEGLMPVRLGNSSELEVGEDVIAIGHALGLAGGPTVSKGVVSALGRSINTSEQATIVDLIQTDASINPGNSGGALVNNRGEVIGINTAIIQGGRGIGFAINIDDAKVVVAQLIEKGRVDRGFLGITPFNMTPSLANRLGIAATEGVIVARVIPGTAAAEAGLMFEDVIIQLGDEPITNTGELSKFLISHLPGETVDLIYVRGEEEIRSQLTLRERPEG